MTRHVPSRDLAHLTLADPVVAEFELDVRIVADAIVGVARRVRSERRSLHDVIFHVDFDGSRVRDAVQRIGRRRGSPGLIRLHDHVLRKRFGRPEIRPRIVQTVGGPRLLIGIEPLAQRIGEVERIAEHVRRIENDVTARRGIARNNRRSGDHGGSVRRRDRARHGRPFLGYEGSVRPRHDDFVVDPGEPNDARAWKREVRQTRRYSEAAEPICRDHGLDEVGIELTRRELDVDLTGFPPNREQPALRREPLGERCDRRRPRVGRSRALVALRASDRRQAREQNGNGNRCNEVSHCPSSGEKAQRRRGAALARCFDRMPGHPG